MSDSEVSPEAELGKTSAKHPQGDCLEAEEVLNEDVKEEGVDGSKEDGEDDEMYDIDIDTDDERTERKDGDVWREDGVSWSGHEEACSAAARMSGSVDDEEHRIKQEAEAPEDREESHTELKESTMTEESHRSSAAEISVTSNGDLDQNPETVFQRDPFPSVDGSQNLSESCVPTTEGINESGPYKGSASLPTSPVTPIAPSSAVASRLARSSSDSQAEKGVMEAQANSGAVVLADDLKSPAMEKLDLVRKWSINTYKCTRQMLSEKLGRGSRTVDVELEAQIEILRENKKKYQHVIRLAQALASQLAQIIQTQKQLGDAFSDLSLKSPELHDEFGYNADTQKLLAKNGETLLGAINFFISSVNTLVDKTIEDTMLNIKQYEFARIEYDAYRTDLEELNLGPRDTNTLPKIEQSQQLFQAHREKYERMRNDVSVKLKFLEENKVKVLHNQLILFHNAIAAYYAGNQQQLEQTLKQFHIKLKMPGGDSPSWLEEH
ncbi:arfaptin-1 isoform X1 [Takifugu flavidus]|uniref:Arfaptin-1 ADP-ribosylation factor-interacting protein 1 n=2 Tax=Takifugu flavidus TaxID=433684 RepID=A0A5C6MUA1_9TELE|nr:arfaptin-1 isoform X1 [Takifugu flavidus]TWW58844.1 Arfaptin-1 ADP-ribosylation factor-interacting protein 1 [Takifugu flavidus]